MCVRHLAVLVWSCTLVYLSGNVGAAEDPPAAPLEIPAAAIGAAPPSAVPAQNLPEPPSVQPTPPPSELSLPGPLQITAPPDVLRIDYFAQPDLPSQQQTEFFNLEHRARIMINLNGPIGKRWRVGAKLEYEYALFHRLYQDVRDDETVHAISIRPLFVYAKNRWAVIAELGPVVSTTFASPFSYRDWRLKLFSAIMYTLRPTLVLRFGVFGVTGFSGNTFFSPGIGLAWRPRPNILFDFYLPLWISFTYTPIQYLTLFIRATVDIVSFDETFQNPGGPVIRDSPVIGYPRTGLGIRVTPYRGIHADLASGFSTEGAGSFFEKNLTMNGFRPSLFVQSSIIITADLFVRPAQNAQALPQGR